MWEIITAKMRAIPVSRQLFLAVNKYKKDCQLSYGQVLIHAIKHIESIYNDDGYKGWKKVADLLANAPIGRDRSRTIAFCLNGMEGSIEMMHKLEREHISSSVAQTIRRALAVYMEEEGYLK